MNTFKTLVLACMMVLLSATINTVDSQTIPVSPFEGLGTVEYPYIIANAEQLSNLAYYVNNGKTYSGVYFRLSNDINLNPGVTFNPDFTYTSVDGAEPKQWTPIGIGMRGQRFSGHFDGNGHKISGLYPKVVKGEMYNGVVNGNDAYYFSGLFGVVDGGSITNLTIDNSLLLIEGDSLKECFEGNPMNIGLVAGCLKGDMSNCKNYGHILAEKTNSTYIGGLVGLLNGNINTCENHGNITNRGMPEWDYYNSNCLGGVFGSGGGDTIESLLNTGSIRTEKGPAIENGGTNMCGGIAHSIRTEYSVKNLVNEGNIYNGSGIAIGLIADSLVSMCNKGCIFNGCGIAKSADAHVLSGFCNEGDVSAESAYTSHIAGLVSLVYYFSNRYGIHNIENCWNTGSVTHARNYAAGLFVTLDNESQFDSKTDNNWVVEKSFNIGKITSGSSAYGLMCWGPEKLFNCYNSGLLTGDVTEALGSNVDELENCFNYEYKEYRDSVGWEGLYVYADFVFSNAKAYKNIFYLAPESSDVTKPNMGIAMSAADFANGKVLAALNAGQEKSPWYQNATDRYPKLSEVDDTMSALTSPVIDRVTDNDGRIYDMLGRYVGSDPTVLPMGLYIKNGKKFIVR
ncbi:MAG: hypothetical protein NC411_06970 [Bacteroides sp.]|nr:hypothetical protein [Bacteroides sp.]